MNKGNLPNVFLFDMENYISRGRRAYLNMLETISRMLISLLMVHTSNRSCKNVFDNLKKLLLRCKSVHVNERVLGHQTLHKRVLL